jgi:hypothetical protein
MLTVMGGNVSFYLLAPIAIFNGEDGYLERNSAFEMTVFISLQESEVGMVSYKILYNPFYLSLTTLSMVHGPKGLASLGC